MLADLEVYQLNIFVAGLISFRFGYQSSWEVDID
jgi:hypothetical protein